MSKGSAFRAKWELECGVKISSHISSTDDVVTFTQSDIDDLESQFKNFLKKYHADKNFKQIVQEASKNKTFAEQWKLFYKDYPMLGTLGGGLATTFPGTSTVEFDFSVIGWEKDEYRTRLSNLSLEGVLHAKQRKELKHMEGILNQLKA